MTKKFSELTADTAPTSDDIMAITNDPGGTPASRKVTLANLWFQLQKWLFAADAGSTDSYAITLSPAITAYVNGQLYRFKANTANTGAATLAINGLTAKTIKKAQGGVTTDLATNDIRAGQMVDVVYDSGNDIFQMQSTLGNAPSSGLSGSLTSPRIPYASGASSLTDSANLTWDNAGVVLNVGANTNHGAINLSNNGQDFISSPIGEMDISSSGAIYMYPGNSVSWAFTTSGGGSKALIPYGSDGGFDIGSTGGGGKRIAKLYFKGSLQGIQDTIVASTPFINHTVTWNDGGTTFDNIVSDVTDTASAAASTLINLKVGGNSKFKVDKTGKIVVGGAFELVVACSDETTALATGTAKVTFRMPRAVSLTAVRASLTTAQASGSIFTVDINESGSTILSTKLTIDNTEKTSTTAATPPVISDANLADDAEMTVDIDQIGDGTATGLKITLIGVYA